MNFIANPIIGGFLNQFTIRSESWVYNWLTPIWVLSLGALVGCLAVALLCGIGWLVSRITPVSKLAEHAQGRWVLGALLGLILLVLWYPHLSEQVDQRMLAQNAGSHIVESLWMYLPAFCTTFLAGVAVVCLCSRKLQDELPLLMAEGPFFWTAVMIGMFAIYGIAGVIWVRDPDGMLESLARWPQTGRSQEEFVVIANSKEPEQQFAVRWRKAELRQLEFRSNESLRIAGYSLLEKGNPPSFDISGGEALSWTASKDVGNPFQNLDEITTLYARNLGNEDATLTIIKTTAPAIPEMLTVPVLAISVVGLFLTFVSLYALLPKLSAIALATAKSEMNTPFYIILTVVGAFLLFLFLWLPYNTFGEDIKMLKFTSLDIIRMLAMLQTIWSASASVADEVEGKTALTVLSKPVSRRDFILGKFVGIAWLVMVMFVVYGSVMLVSVAYKPVYDIREGGNVPDRPGVSDPLGLFDVTHETGLTAEEVNWHVCASEMVSSIPALVLVYFEVLVMAALSVAISTRLGLVANFTICLAIFALGHLTPLMVQSNVVAERFEAVIFVGQLISTILPGLDYFDSSPAIAQGKAIQIAYVGVTLLYTALYSVIAMLLALVFFEDRDLA
jgi:ABC-2 family transporter protein